MVLGKLPCSPNSNANSKPNPDPDWGPIFLGAIFRTPIKICFTWMKKMMIKVFLTECKFILTKWYFDIMKKRWYNENIFITYEIVLIEWKYIWNLFLQHFSNHINYIEMKSRVSVIFLHGDSLLINEITKAFKVWPSNCVASFWCNVWFTWVQSCCYLFLSIVKLASNFKEKANILNGFLFHNVNP